MNIRLKCLWRALPVALSTSLVGASCLAPSTRQAVFFPTFGYRSSTAQGWVVPIHAWLFEPAMNPTRRRALLRNVLGIPEPEKTNPQFLAREDFFLVHSLKKQMLDLTLDKELFHLRASDDGGHLIDQLTLPGTLTPGWLKLSAGASCDADAAPILAEVQLLSPHGRLVVSDIDDTIKVTEVAHRATLIAHTFLKPFESVAGMAEVYRRWSARDPGTAFCYMSASPWQLYPALEGFLRDAGFPRGVLCLKRFRLKDRSFFALFESPVTFKTPLLEDLFQHFPERTFMLVGDSGEKDPEIYGAFARRYPRQVAHIYIRQLNAADTPERFTRAFAGVPTANWSTFRDAREIHD